MNSRYWMIAGGIVLLVVVAVALVWSQVRRTTTLKEETGTAEVISPTSSTLALVQQMELTITNPADGATVSSPQLLIRGKTAKNAEVFINEKELLADEGGNFSTTLTLDEGDNLIIVTANDENGSVAEKELVVTYNIEG